mmetsp:Transcript_6150/g.22617  ORF Transcript_6150/g.22617 Transcript_6150/m.22617 type:complete len:152 (+) Transcript_6150:92-547(+)
MLRRYARAVAMAMLLVVAPVVEGKDGHWQPDEPTPQQQSNRDHLRGNGEGLLLWTQGRTSSGTTFWSLEGTLEGLPVPRGGTHDNAGPGLRMVTSICHNVKACSGPQSAINVDLVRACLRFQCTAAGGFWGRKPQSGCSCTARVPSRSGQG